MSNEPTSQAYPSSASGNDRSKATRVYAVLRRRIRELTIPPGAPLRKEDVALELGVSRAPVSEGIALLADEALVDVFPQQGSFVAPIRANDVRESLFIRTALEIEAIRRVAQFADPMLIAQLDENLEAQSAALKAEDLPLFHDLDENFHAAIFSAIRHPRALRMLETARAALDRPRRLALPEKGRGQATFAEHCRLVDSIKSGDPEFAGAAMRAHLSKVAKSIDRALAHIEAKRG